MNCKHERIAAHPLPGANWFGVCLECGSIAIVDEYELECSGEECSGDMFTPLPEGAAKEVRV